MQHIRVCLSVPDQIAVVLALDVTSAFFTDLRLFRAVIRCANGHLLSLATLKAIAVANPAAAVSEGGGSEGGGGEGGGGLEGGGLGDGEGGGGEGS